MRREPLLIWSSTLVGLQVLTGGAALADVIGPKLAGLFVLIVAACQAGTQFYVRGQLTPTTDVIAQRNAAGVVVAGPAAPGHVVEGEPVDVAIDRAV